MMLNSLDIYYTYTNIGRGLAPVSKKSASGLKPVSNKKTASGLKPVSKEGKCKKIGKGLKLLQ